MAATNTNAADTCLEGGLTVLRPICPADLPRLAAWDADPEIIALMGRKFADGAETPEEWYRRVLTNRRCRVLAIETFGGDLIGEIALDRIDWRLGTAELRICIGEQAYWGRGYGTDAVRTVLQLAFGRLRLRVIYLRVYETNRRAVRCYERLGFTVQGVLAPSRRRGDTSPILLMSLSRERYLRRQIQQTAAVSS